MLKTIRDFTLEGKTILLRSDFNVPMKDGKILDDTRIRKGLKTINYALDKNAKIIILSHLGRIKTEEDLAKNTLKPVAERLSSLLGREVSFLPKTRGEEVNSFVGKMKNQDIVMLENTRYEDLDGKKESGCDEELSKYWASLGDIFINDAFGTLHRAHASNVGISKYLPKGIGLLVEQEIASLSILKNPPHPYTIMLGGSKVKDKIGLIDALLPLCDKLLIGGGMAFTFLSADGYSVGNSLLDQDSVSYCKDLIEKYKEKLILPLDVVCSKNMDENSPSLVKDMNEIDFDEMGLDIGPKTVELYKKYIKDAEIVFWNGPFGVYEIKKYSKGTNQLLQYLKDENIKTILGGGDIVAVAENLKITDDLYHVSTGGGASLEYLEGKELPGLKAIEEG